MIFPNPVTFVRAMLRAAKAALSGRALFVDNDTLRYRVDECIKRPCYQDGQCLECTCLVALKARLATESCPRKHWRRDLVNTSPLS